MIPLKDDNPTSGKPIVTYLIISCCILIFLIQLTSQSYKTGQLFYSYGLIPSVLMGNNQLPMDLYAVPAWITIFTSMFMHGGFMHLAGNMLYMWIFADNIEDDLGKNRFLIFYLLAGVGAGMTQVLMDTYSEIPMVGASGAIGGVLGAYLINYPNAKVLVLIPFGFFSQLIKIRALYVLGFWFILQFISSGGGIDYAAHIGGFISGIILILFFNKKVKRINKSKKKNKIVKGPWG
jgi:membrane associated rhomboid family serine protease